MGRVRNYLGEATSQKHGCYGDNSSSEARQKQQVWCKYHHFGCFAALLMHLWAPGRRQYGRSLSRVCARVTLLRMWVSGPVGCSHVCDLDQDHLSKDPVRHLERPERDRRSWRRTRTRPGPWFQTAPGSEPPERWNQACQKRCKNKKACCESVPQRTHQPGKHV